MIKIFPTSDNIFVKRIEPTKITEGGIVVPDLAQDRPAEGTIVALGPEVMTPARRASEIQDYLEIGEGRRPEAAWAYTSQTFDLGDHVMFGQFAGIDVKIDDQTYVKVRPDEIFCVLWSVSSIEQSEVK